MHDCFNQLEESSNYSASLLQTNIIKNTSSITGRGVESQMLYVSPRVHNFIGRGEYPTLYTPAKHTALSYNATHY